MLEVPILSVSTWKRMEMSNNFLLTSTLSQVLASISLVWKRVEMGIIFVPLVNIFMALYEQKVLAAFFIFALFLLRT